MFAKLRDLTVKTRGADNSVLRLADDGLVTKKGRNRKVQHHHMLALWAQKWKGEGGVHLSDLSLLFTGGTDEDVISAVMIVFWLGFEGLTSGWFVGTEICKYRFFRHSARIVNL